MNLSWARCPTKKANNDLSFRYLPMHYSIHPSNEDAVLNVIPEPAFRQIDSCSFSCLEPHLVPAFLGVVRGVGVDDKASAQPVVILTPCFEQRVFNGRFIRQDVEGRSRQMPFAQRRFDEVKAFDDATPRRIDEARSRPHPRNEGGVY